MPIDMLRIYRVFVCPQKFCKGYLRRGLTQGDEIWQDDRSGWVAGHPHFRWTLAKGLAPKVKR